MPAQLVAGPWPEGSLAEALDVQRGRGVADADQRQSYGIWIAERAAAVGRCAPLLDALDGSVSLWRPWPRRLWTKASKWRGLGALAGRGCMRRRCWLLVACTQLGG